ncbi:MAG: ATP:corrinoid adenosyltransferase BtuR/CobO/CobP [Berkelbacteria bacterium GW2011_GWA1_36_9]|uniref:ATP:corrinoid adenosyltransferase BtuR/CobO/CobP n=1 Tax=Berkelbacteria bacterium GW2011_GWA1_36_9 TaxID=1618331 RepID=A0A0G0FC10_9BACT|nr:MAG: ATP:corrinoid adenosyltransferase BtuR/CobO/CobP [Berkelbacteria bacterium GW2011_GWA1_36_9]
MIHIYTGEGKGKTTAALGLALRALGAQKRVAIIQFMKKGDSSEIKAIKKHKLPIDVFTFGIGFFKILGDNKPPEKHKQATQKGLKKARQIIEKGDFDLIILDEINVALDYNLIIFEEVVEIIKLNKKAELILTGRNAPSKLIKIADLVSVIQKNKHYFDTGVKARKGIEF